LACELGRAQECVDDRLVDDEGFPEQIGRYRRALRRGEATRQALQALLAALERQTFALERAGELEERLPVAEHRSSPRVEKRRLGSPEAAGEEGCAGFDVDVEDTGIAARAAPRQGGGRRRLVGALVLGKPDIAVDAELRAQGIAGERHAAARGFGDEL